MNGAPAWGSRAATPERGCPPASVSIPAISTPWGATSSVATTPKLDSELETAGAHGSSIGTLPDTSSDASRRRGTPATVAKSPAAKRRAPSARMTRIVSSTGMAHGATDPVVPSTSRIHPGP